MERWIGGSKFGWKSYVMWWRLDGEPVGDVIPSRARPFSPGGSDGVKPVVSQRAVLVEIFAMIKCACVSISSVKQIMYEWKRECEVQCKGKRVKLEAPSWTAARSQDLRPHTHPSPLLANPHSPASVSPLGAFGSGCLLFFQLNTSLSFFLSLKIPSTHWKSSASVCFELNTEIHNTCVYPYL